MFKFVTQGLQGKVVLPPELARLATLPSIDIEARRKALELATYLAHMMKGEVCMHSIIYDS